MKVSANDSDTGKGTGTEDARKELRKMFNEQMNPIYEDTMKLLERDGNLLTSLSKLPLDRRMTIREQALLQNILYGLISSQGDTQVNILKILNKIKDAQLQSFDWSYVFMEAVLDELAQQVINPLKEQTKNIAETVRVRLAELSKPREIELKVPENIQKELQLWVDEREKAKQAAEKARKAAEKYTG